MSDWVVTAIVMAFPTVFLAGVGFGSWLERKPALKRGKQRRSR